MRLQSHYHDEAKFHYDPKKHGQQVVTKICRCPVPMACYIYIKPTSKHLASVGFIDGHDKERTDVKGVTKRNLIYFN